MRPISMAKRKQTTASPEKIPMNTDKTRKRRSSRKTDRSSAPRDRRGNDATVRGCLGSVSIAVSELSNSSTLVPFVQSGDQEQCHVDSGRRTARRVGLAFDVKHQTHRRLYKARIWPQ